MRKLVILLLLDAFRPDYLRYTPFLRQLALQGARGRFQEPFGFTPRDAYFGGRYPSESGYTNMFWYDPDNSPFSFARYLPTEYAAESSHRVRAWVNDEARRRVLPFAAKYLSSFNIPINALPFFDVTEVRAPWDKSVGYRSLFHILDEQGFDWFECAWPTYNGLKGVSDGAVTAYAINNLQNTYRFAYIHLSRLDEIGHVFGPGSKEIASALLETDSYIQILLEHCYNTFDTVDVVAFGDHGMVNVVGKIELCSKLANAGLLFGRDYVCFLDSTMARFWPLNTTVHRAIEEALQHIAHGRVLGEPDCEYYHISGCDPRNGHLYFVADAGYIIEPSFFQNEASPRGMHGYAPDIFDNQGVFIVNAQSRQVRGDLGLVDAIQITPTVLDLLGIDDSLTTHHESALAKSGAYSRRSRYTLEPSGSLDKTIEKQLAHAVAVIQKNVPDAQAIILTGGFGRGEGSFVDEKGARKPLNDYDLMVASREADPKLLKSVGAELAQQFGLDYVDVGVLYPEALDGLFPTMFVYDLKHGSQVLWGDAGIIARIPQFAPREIPLNEGVQLLLNRVAGLLLGFTERLVYSSSAGATDNKFAFIQVIKTLIAIGDWYLLKWGAYDTSYSVRRQRWVDLGQASGLNNETRQLVEQGYTLKLVSDFRDLPPLWKQLELALPPLRNALIDAFNTVSPVDGIQPLEDSNSLSVDLLRHYLYRWIEFSKDLLSFRIANLRGAMVLTLFAIADVNKPRKDYLIAAYDLLYQSGLLSPDESALERQQVEYEKLRHICVQQWETLCH